jgi:hypothetical protein
VDTSPPMIIADDPEGLPALRDLFSRYPLSRDWSADQLTDVLGTHVAAIGAALDALLVEGEVFA